MFPQDGYRGSPDGEMKLKLAKIMASTGGL